MSVFNTSSDSIKFSKKVLSFCLSIFLCLAVYPTFANPKDTDGVMLNKVSIPYQLGIIKEVYQPHILERHTRIIFHIQDLHADYEAQKNLAGILEYLAKEYGIRLVLVEGGITDRDFSYIRQKISLKERRKKAEELLREGEISGETYVDIATDLKLKFQGIEDKNLYQKNIKLYLELDSLRADILRLLRQLRQNIENLKKYMYTKKLLSFDRYIKSYNTEKIGLTEYLEFLEKSAIKEKINLEDYLNYKKFLMVMRLEKEIEYEKARKERDSLIEHLKAILTVREMKRLVFESLRYKDGEVSSLDYYTYLSRLAKEKGVDLKTYKSFFMYINYIGLYNKIDYSRLFDEIRRIEGVLLNILCKNSSQKAIFMVSKDIDILDAFFKLRLTPEDFDYYKSHKSRFNIKKWKDIIKRECEHIGIEVKLPHDISLIEKGILLAEIFYKTAYERDLAFLKNSLEKMKEENERLAFLIAGGFHTRQLTQLFKKHNISYIVIAPRTKERDQRLYDRILKKSYKIYAE